MRPSRRVVAAGIGALAFGGAGVALWRRFRPLRGGDVPLAIEVSAEAIPAFHPSEPGRTRFGSLTFRSGLVLTSPHDGFGGLSGLWRSPDGGELVAVSDNAQWLTARIETEADGRLRGLSRARMAPILGQDGVPLRQGLAYDTESLAIAGDEAYVASERVHELRRFRWGRDGVLARGAVLPLPREVDSLPANAGLEAVAVAPAGHPLAGRIVAIAEEAVAGRDAPTRGWVVTGGEPFAFSVARSEDFDVTDLAFLPSGEAMLLERRFSVFSGVACRIRRIARDAIRPGATLDGPVIFEADRSHEIDNMEGLAIHREAATGQTIVTLVSDDNFQFFQRTLLLEFSLDLT